MKNRAGLWPMAIALIVCTLLATNSYTKNRKFTGTISVKGCAEKQITSDFVTWDGTISTKGETLTEAYEKLENDTKLLNEYFLREKVNPVELTMTPIRTQTLFKSNDQGYTTNTIEGYILTQGFSIATTDINSVKRMSQDITSLIKTGVEIISFSPQYIYRHIDELKILMLGQAARDAKQRADTLIASTGSQTGGLRSAQQGVFQITPAYSTVVSDYGEYDTSSIEKTIKAVVTMDFVIE